MRAGLMRCSAMRAGRRDVAGLSALRGLTVCGLAILAGLAPSAWGQQNAPHIGYVYPAGGQQESSFEAVVGGQFLNSVKGAMISGDGVRVMVLESVKPLQQQQVSAWRDRLKELNEKRRLALGGKPGAAANGANPASNALATANTSATASASNTPATTVVSVTDNASATAGNALAGGSAPATAAAPASSAVPANGTASVANTAPVVWTAADQHEANEIRLMLAQYQKRTQNPAIGEKVRLQITVEHSAAAGKRELRLVTANGATNPIYFYVGRLPEWRKLPAGTVTEAEINEQGDLRRNSNNPLPTPVVDVTTPLIVNGQVAAGGVDQYRFAAHKGERLVIAASARELIPYIADAVPGWFQASLTLYDANGKELKYADHYGFHPDPVLLYEIPADGMYTVAIHDSIYRGREDFVYRMMLGEVSFVTAMFPLGGYAGDKTKVEFAGWNLPQTHLTEHSGEKQKSVQTLSVGEEEFNARPFAFDTLPEMTVKGNIQTREKAQRLVLPVIVNGRVSQPDEEEFFQFKGRAGQQIEAEVMARRLDSPLDSVLTLTDANGKVLAANDDFYDESEGLITDHADSRILYKLPADGTYFLRLNDSQGNGGPEFAYRLQVSPAEPDFELRITPSNIDARAGTVVPITVHALRLGGFDGDIVLRLKDAPQGFQLGGEVIPGNQSEIQMTLNMPELGGNRTSHLTLVGEATIAGKLVQRTSVPADDWEQAFFFHHLVETSEMLVTVNGQQKRPPWMGAHWDRPLEMGKGRPAVLKFNLLLPPTAPPKFALSDAPEGIAVDHVESMNGGFAVYVTADKAKAGLRGNLILSMITDRPNPQAKGKVNTLTVQLPAIPFVVPAVQPTANTTPQ